MASEGKCQVGSEALTKKSVSVAWAIAALKRKPLHSASGDVRTGEGRHHGGQQPGLHAVHARHDQAPSLTTRRFHLQITSRFSALGSKTLSASWKRTSSQRRAREKPSSKAAASASAKLHSPPRRASCAMTRNGSGARSPKCARPSAKLLRQEPAQAATIAILCTSKSEKSQKHLETQSF